MSSLATGELVWYSVFHVVELMSSALKLTIECDVVRRMVSYEPLFGNIGRNTIWQCSP